MKQFYSVHLPTRIDLLGAALPAGAPLAVGLALHPPACCGGADGWEEGVLEGGHCWGYQERYKEAEGSSTEMQRTCRMFTISWCMLDTHLNIARRAKANVV